MLNTILDYCNAALCTKRCHIYTDIQNLITPGAKNAKLKRWYKLQLQFTYKTARKEPNVTTDKAGTLNIAVWLNNIHKYFI